MIISIIIYNYQSEKNSKFEKFLNSNDLDIINNEICTKPTKDNPFMNPNLINTKNKFKSCSIENERVMKHKKREISLFLKPKTKTKIMLMFTNNFK